MFSGLVQPTGVEFASDGRVFVAEKSGIIGLRQPPSRRRRRSPTCGRRAQLLGPRLLGLALDRAFPEHPYVYVLYTYDASSAATLPVGHRRLHQTTGRAHATGDGSVVSGRCPRLTVGGNAMAAPSRSWSRTGASSSQPLDREPRVRPRRVAVRVRRRRRKLQLRRLRPGRGHVRGADAQESVRGSAGWHGASLTAPTAEGGALRSQDVRLVRRPSVARRTIIRIDPRRGRERRQPVRDRHRRESPADRRVRPPQPVADHDPPGTSEIWVGDVGWSTWRRSTASSPPRTRVADNFGWPCYEGGGGRAAPTTTAST